MIRIAQAAAVATIALTAAFLIPGSASADTTPATPTARLAPAPANFIWQ